MCIVNFIKQSPRRAVTVLVLSPGLIVGMYFLVRAAMAALDDSSWWDDHLIVAVSWLGCSGAIAVVVQLVWAIIAPQRWLPRWLAIVALLVLAGFAASWWWRYAVAAAMGSP